jgi:hypothetical protein
MPWIVYQTVRTRQLEDQVLKLRESIIPKYYRHPLCNFSEIKISIISRHKSRKSDKKLGEWWVNVNEITRLDVSRGELAKMDFVESGYFERFVR